MNNFDFDYGIKYCNHKRQDRLRLKVGDKVVHVAPRCLECGQMKAEDGEWWRIPIMVLQFMYAEEWVSARRCIQLMEEGREKLDIPYPDYTEEDYRGFLEGIRGELDEIKKLNIN